TPKPPASSRRHWLRLLTKSTVRRPPPAEQGIRTEDLRIGKCGELNVCTIRLETVTLERAGRHTNRVLASEGKCGGRFGPAADWIRTNLPQKASRSSASERSGAGEQGATQ